ncbi:MAG: PbsX family transcriptional regulator [Alphaproteobacteria bacterium PA4]|nr:MAG: PbsX family transcriptional regulator [Alphaproteobacteria bacterium PA4]
MRSAVRKWGNSPSIRIPAALMAASGLRIDQPVDVQVEDGRLVITPIVIADPAFAAALVPTLAEWAGAADETAWADL